MKGTFLLLIIISTLFAIGKCYIECYTCIEGRRGNNIQSCSHFFSNPTTICWNTNYCGKMVQISSHHHFRHVIVYTCFDYEENNEKNGTESHELGVFRKRIKSTYNGMDMEIFICNTSLCNSASSFSLMGLFVPIVILIIFQNR
ncbi:uncharacterized protein LOC117173122 [Belonocnema kinseyi]|uniref:uncharacterized protein LOC117173122 n=1 Tax=Belonocnema kinseyi TaxID=2817044 RepID=UPI00143D63C9|nr:uncharacterized protein LOC117173122 [Belonocnema kinseyi]